MQLIDLNNLKIVEKTIEEVEIVELELNTTNVLSQTVSELAEQLYGILDRFFVRAALDSSKNYWFKLVWNDDSFTASDVDYVQELLLEALALRLIREVKREREQRLAIPKTLNDVNLSYSKIMRLINNVTKVDCFGAEAIVSGFSKQLVEVV